MTMIIKKKTNDKIFQKIQKNLFLGHFGPFSPKFQYKRIFLEKGLCQFLNIPIIYHGANHSWEECRNDGRKGFPKFISTH